LIYIWWSSSAQIAPSNGCSPTQIGRFAAAGIDVQSLSVQLQDEGAKSFVNSWNDLMTVIKSKCAVLEQVS
jgi:transaldolase